MAVEDGAGGKEDEGRMENDGGRDEDGMADENTAEDEGSRDEDTAKGDEEADDEIAAAAVDEDATATSALNTSTRLLLLWIAMHTLPAAFTATPVGKEKLVMTAFCVPLLYSTTTRL